MLSIPVFLSLLTIRISIICCSDVSVGLSHIPLSSPFLYGTTLFIASFEASIASFEYF